MKIDRRTTEAPDLNNEEREKETKKRKGGEKPEEKILKNDSKESPRKLSWRVTETGKKERDF